MDEFEKGIEDFKNEINDIDKEYEQFNIDMIKQLNNQITSCKSFYKLAIACFILNLFVIGFEIYTRMNLFSIFAIMFSLACLFFSIKSLKRTLNRSREALIRLKGDD